MFHTLVSCVKSNPVLQGLFKLSSPQEATGCSVAVTLTGCLSLFSLSVHSPPFYYLPSAAQFPCAVLYSLLDWLGGWADEIAFEGLAG